MNRYIQIAILVVVAAAAVYLLPHKVLSPHTTSDNVGSNSDADAEVIDFETCAEAGYPISDRVPETCTTPAGETYTASVAEDPEVVLDTPVANELVKSPLVIKGRAKNNWFFEANIPVTLFDSNGTVIVKQGFHSTTDWTLPGYVEFSGTLTFSQPATDTGRLVIEKDNPSGLPQFDASYGIPVRFR